MRINNWFRIYTGRDYFIVVCYGLMGLALAVGTYFRLKGLGKSPFAFDEYYIASSVRNILEHGLPQFDCGGYYVRGLLIQYLVAPLFKYGSNDELYFRLITVISNLLAIPAIYLLGQRIAGKAVACFVVVLFSVSVWETEMARFARMYAPFQMLFVWYLYFLYKALFLKDAKARRWMYWISLISVFVFEGAIFLVILNFIPLVVDIRKIRLSEYFASFLIFIIAYAFLTTDWETMGAQSNIPTDLPRTADFPVYTMRESIGPIELPVLLLPTLISDLSWTIGFAVPLILSFIAIWQLFARARLGKIGEITRLQASIISSFIIMSLFNQFGLLIVLSIILIVTDRLFHWFNLNTIKARSLALPVVAIVTTFGFWLSYAIFSKEWRALLDTWILFDAAKGNIPLKQVLTILFGYPDIYFKIVSHWLKTMPIETTVISSLAIYGLLMTLVKRHSDSEGYLFLVGILVILSLIIGVLHMFLMGMRYNFFMYPAVLLVVILSLNRLAQSFPESARFRNVYMAVLVSIFLLVSEDFNIDHLWNIDSDRILYRLKYDAARRGQYYNRYDFRSPALLVNEGIKNGDIVISTIYSVPYYLRQLDYFYVNQGAFWIGGIMVCNGKRDLWANAELIYKPEKLFALLKNARATTWLIVDVTTNKWAKPELDKVREIFGHYRIFQTVDGNIEVYRIPPQSERVD
jgi:hypothetical protein